MNDVELKITPVAAGTICDHFLTLTYRILSQCLTARLTALHIDISMVDISVVFMYPAKNSEKAEANSLTQMSPRVLLELIVEFLSQICFVLR